MSEFLPEQTQSAPSGITQFSPANPQTTTDDVALMQRVFQAAAANPLMIPTDLMAYILDYVQTSRLIIPIGQVFGFSQFNPNIATPVGNDTVTSTTYAAPVSAAGPTLSGLPKGRYLVLQAAYLQAPSGGNVVFMSVKVNTTEAVDADAAKTEQNGVPGMTFSVHTLDQESNTLETRYRVSTGTANIDLQKLAAIKYANL